jgi:L-threonylcarbamoyladenylate synthase
MGNSDDPKRPYDQQQPEPRVTIMEASLKTILSKPDDRAIAMAVDVLNNGGCVAFPTETVYGLGADARNSAAVAAIYAAKGRPSFNPLIVHVPSLDIAEKIAVFSDMERQLAQQFWPGPLTMVLPLRSDSGIAGLVTAGLDTVAIRVPQGETAHRLLMAFNGPIAAPSANPSGQLSPTKAAHVYNGLSGKVNMILDGGDCSVGLESTIIRRVNDTQIALLREGGFDPDRLPFEVIKPSIDPDRPSAPGQLLSHYAPQTPLRLNADMASSDELLLGFGPINATLNLSLTGNVIEAAANLFDFLHQMDAIAGTQNAASIAVSPIPMHGLGAAINDRLQRAAAPRNF